MSNVIRTARRAIDECGGHLAVALLLGVDMRVVWNWRTRRLPPDTYDVLAPLLRANGFEFSPRLFSQRPAVMTMEEVQRRLVRRAATVRPYNRRRGNGG